MKILMTGGAGYVGSACLRWMVERGHDVLAYDNLSAGNAAAVPDADRRLVVGDILDGDRLAATMRSHGTEAVMHFAALASVPDSVSDPDRYWLTNVVGTKHVLDAMRTVGVGRIVFSSTAATYGFRSEMPLTEESPQLPETPYGSTKLAAEWLIGEYCRAYLVGAAMLRYFNASGADADGRNGEDRREESHLIPIVLQAALGQRPHVKVFGRDWPTRDGTCVRDYVHVADLAQAHELALARIEPGRSAAYNVGSGVGTTVAEILAACEEVVGSPIPSESADRRTGDPAVLVASPQSIQRDLGWEPRHSDIRTIVSTAWRWHRDHPDGYNTRTTEAPDREVSAAK